jgi:transcriptional regulator with XRE-family HTH domain
MCRGSSFPRLARAAKRGTLDRRSAEEWTKLLGVSRQRFHQIKSALGIPSRRALVRKAVTARSSWKARAPVLWRLGIYDRQGDCWSSSRASLSTGGRLNPSPADVKGSKRRVLHRLRYGYSQRNGCFELPTCGHDWCIRPEHQKLIGFGVSTQLRAISRAERVASALEAGQSYREIARREGISPRYVSQINTGRGMRGVRDKYPIRVGRRGRRPKLETRDGAKP